MDAQEKNTIPQSFVDTINALVSKHVTSAIQSEFGTVAWSMMKIVEALKKKNDNTTLTSQDSLELESAFHTFISYRNCGPKEEVREKVVELLGVVSHLARSFKSVKARL